MEKETQVWIVYFSPAGSTRRVAETLAKTAKDRGYNVVRIDLADHAAGSSVSTLCETISEKDLLLAGSPTYANHPVPAVMNFLQKLPADKRPMGAVFTTYGVVSSGVTLAEMAEVMTEKNIVVLGGIKVVAEHSMTWHLETPVGQGRPHAEDIREVERFMETVLKKAAESASPAFPLKNLYYQNEEAHNHAKESSLAVLQSLLLPMNINAELCTQCGVCVSNCPTGNITLDFLPVFGNQCVMCFNCVRCCEFGAITSNVLPFLEGEIRKRLDFFQEPQVTASFL